MSDAVSKVIQVFAAADRSGNLAMAELCDVSRQAVSNWKAEGFIPERHHYRIFQAAQKQGLKLPDGWNVVPAKNQGGQPEGGARDTGQGEGPEKDAAA